MKPITHAAGLYLALLQLLFTLGWTVYAIYLPRLAAEVGISRGAVIFILMLDQAIFTIGDFATGVAADKVSRIVGRIGIWVAGLTLLSSAAFLALPFIASAHSSAAFFLGVTIVWAVTSSALRAPPLMLLGKYAAKPAQPYLASLALFGYGMAGAVAPYLALTLREIDPRWPFFLASVSVAGAACGLVVVERMLARQAQPTKQAAPSGTAVDSLTKPAFVFALAMIVLALGYQLHFALNSAALFLRFAKPADIEWLMPIFWIGFNIAMFPASVLTRKWGGYAVMGAAGLLGAAAIFTTALAGSLGVMVAAQFAAGAAWGCILMSAFSVAFAIGENGAEGRMSGLLFSTLALATFARMAAVASGLQADPEFAPLLAWLPPVCWALAGATLLTLAFDYARRSRSFRR